MKTCSLILPTRELYTLSFTLYMICLYLLLRFHEGPDFDALYLKTFSNLWLLPVRCI